MAQTVDDLRNEIRVGVGRYERSVSSSFTKEALAAICSAVEYEIDQSNFPPKPEMRAGILYSIGELDTEPPEEPQGPFRKDELEAIAAAISAD